MRGGPVDRFERTVGLVRDEREDVLRRSLVACLVAWAPLMVIAAARWLLTGQVDPILFNLDAHARPLIALPFFFYAERSLEVRTRRAVERFGNFVREADLPAARLAVAKAAARVDSPAAEGILLAVVALNVPLIWMGAPGELVARVPSPAGLWYGVVTLPLFQFLLLRWIWRWAIWSALLWRLSRLDLRLAAIHPDHAGGLDFVQEASVGLSWVFTGLSGLLAARWAGRIAFEGAHLQQFVPILVVFVGLALLVATVPMFFFVRVLYRAWFQARREYSELALRHARLFHQRWIVRDGEDELLGSPDMSSLIDLSSSFEMLQHMRLLPMEPRAVVPVILAAVGPMVPLLFLEFSVTELIQDLANIVLGGGLG